MLSIGFSPTNLSSTSNNPLPISRVGKGFKPNYPMKNYSDLRKISNVFRHYGIDLTGKKKYASFERDLRMVRVFVSGLIFELEYELRREIDDDKVEGVQAPAQLIELLLS